MGLQFQFLGTGWSHGVPMIGCSCRVCRERRPRNLRRRPALLVTSGDFALVVDTGPDFRDQVIAYRVERLDAVALTHAHADHVMGFDDVRRFTWRRESPFLVYGTEQTLSALRQSFHYIRSTPLPDQAVPRVDFVATEHILLPGPLSLSWIPVPHGSMACWGLRFDAGDHSLAYVPDASDLGEQALEQLQDLDVMILNALRPEPHPSHLTLDRALELLEQIGAKRSFLTHMGCGLDYYEINPGLPEGVEMAYDGQIVRL